MNNNHKEAVLFISPLPPPITGNSIMSDAVLKILNKDYIVFVVRPVSNNLISNNMWGYLVKTINAIYTFYKIHNYGKRCSKVYLSASLSPLGNIKDNIILLILHSKIKKTIVHLHGGGLKTHVFDKNRAIMWINRKIMAKVFSFIVLSDSLKDNYLCLNNKAQIFVVPNFVNCYDINTGAIRSKQADNKYKILYLSNMFKDKGYYELFKSVIKLKNKYSDCLELHYAGEFPSNNDKKKFIEEISRYNQIYYHGVLQGVDKNILLSQSHIFCLPTYHKYSEGQPLSILEAYANGCIVIATLEGGIKDIFKNDINGYVVKKKSMSSIVQAIETVVSNTKSKNINISLNNYSESHTKYSKAKFESNISQITKLWSKI